MALPVSLLHSLGYVCIGMWTKPLIADDGG